MHRNLKHIIGCILGMIHLLHAQDIELKSGYSSYKWTPDTLYYNPENDQFVLTQTYNPNKIKPYETHFFHLYNLSELRSESGFERYNFTYRLPHRTFQTNFGDRLHSDLYWTTEKELKNNFIKITKTKADHYLREKELLLPGQRKDTSILFIEFGRYMFPSLWCPLDSLYLQMYFGSLQTYTITLSFFDSLDISIQSNEVCNPFNMSKRTILTNIELQRLLSEYLTQVKLPHLKIENEVVGYRIQFSYDMEGYFDYRIKQEKANGCIHSKKIFPDNDSIFAIVDTFNYRSICFVPSIWESKYASTGRYIVFGTMDLENNLSDITQDGRNDLILDTSIVDHVDNNIKIPIYEIEYIPNSSRPKDYSSTIKQSIKYHKYLGNGFYYCPSSKWEADIYQMKNNEWIPIITMDDLHYDSNQKLRKGYYAHFTVRGNENLSFILPTRTKKADAMRQRTLDLIQSYVEHPEKLPIDFPMN